MEETPHILVVDDDPLIRSLLRRYLIGEGFRVSEAVDGAGVRAALAQDPIHTVLLDLVMPGEDGLSLARQIRQRSNVPIIMLTGKGELIDRVVGLESGADDYVTKPFELRELLARIRAVLRRTSQQPLPELAAAPGETLLFEGWGLDLVKRELRDPAGSAVPLTAGEFELLRVFASNPNRVLSRDRLIELVKGRDWASFDRAIDTQVGRLRKKIEADPANPTLVKTVRGGGYIFAASVRPA
ncbi:MAG TPA: response regulator [Magnetospirillaceae bacterium]|nr:response regulator [Magnetospirillaceae bacterium]